MSIDIGYGLRKPESGDKNFWGELEKLFDAFVAHTHDAANSPSVPSGNISKPTSTIAAVDWTPLPDRGYIQTITVPAGVSLDKSQPVFYITGDPNQLYHRVHPTVDIKSKTSMEVIVNDNAMELKVVYL